MAKRLTGTEKWDKAWFRKLKPKYKCFWEYLRDKCDLIGLWEIDFEAASFHVGEEMSESEILEAFGNKIQKIEDKLLIMGFCHFQYGETLNLKSPIHKKINDLLIKNTLYDTLYNRVLNRVEGIVIVKEEVKVKGESKVKAEKEKPQTIEIVYPFTTETFKTQWQLWKVYKKREHKFNYKTEISENAALKKLENLSGGDEKNAIKILSESIANGYKGFFELPITNKRPGAGGVTEITAAEAFQNQFTHGA